MTSAPTNDKRKLNTQMMIMLLFASAVDCDNE